MEPQEAFESLLKQMNSQVQTQESLSPFFCTLTAGLKTFPEAELNTESIQQKVTSLFKDINTQIELYDNQFKVLQQELGVLCPPSSSPIPTRFFEALLSLFRLAYGRYKSYPELNSFLPPLQTIVTLFETSKFEIKGDLLEQAVLHQLIQFAWALTHVPTTQETMAKQLNKQGGFRTKTRKQRRHL